MNQTENTLVLQKIKTDVVKEHDLSVIEQVVMQGDLAKLDPIQRVTYYHKVCESLGLNPYTQPFAYISLNGKLQLYARKDATEQLRGVKNISITGLEGRVIDDLYIVKAKASMSNGRTDESTGAVTIGSLRGDAKANAIMKAETKAKRRVTLSICGLGWTDESEIDSIPSAIKVNVDLDTGVIHEEIKSVPLQAIALNPPSKPVSKSIDHFAQNENDNSSSTEDIKISDDELKEFLTNYVNTDDIFKTNFEKYILENWQVSDFKDILKKNFNLAMGWVNKNLGMQKMAVK